MRMISYRTARKRRERLERLHAAAIIVAACGTAFGMGFYLMLMVAFAIGG